MENKQGILARVSTLFLAGVIGVAVIGYFVGLADGVPQPDGMLESTILKGHTAKSKPTEKLIAAVTYAEISQTAMGPTEPWQSEAKTLPSSDYDLFAEVIPSPEEKKRSSEIRASRRAFNGAPPIIPHAVEDTTDSACYACHHNGMRMGTLKASVMSHPFLANCTQCHAPPPPKPFQSVDAEVKTSFVGLPAASQGERAFPGAPPTIPHAQWMRENCTACHGGPNGWEGMESTHPWRTHCTQCHAPSASLDQAITVDTIPMLPPLEVSNR
ncbi:diheme cytochrome c precursor [Novipirellula artificiosorum]|uniref:Nitrate reductase cytochrome c-type subunit (NapB) n=1 Tax=Novipirellula artificiosorum TaxID=2528016 RepID=A0A5C6DKK2_9BACT|nr:diheme cytochrome c precursor [Novipirellula artificiosorum]TWU37390.1 Nitrate reductase cytochrome c-type subunit (NapB) [Novipirellula artificiosorum]